MKRDLLKFCYKGDRNYIHGTDIYTYTIKYLANKGYDHPKDFVLMFHRITRNQLLAEIRERGVKFVASDPVVSLAFCVGSKAYQLRLAESDISVDCRIKYDEELICGACEIVSPEKSITYSGRQSFEGIEIVVALNKLLLQSLFPKLEGKWLFTRLVTNETVPRAVHSVCTVKFQHLTKGKFAKSICTMDNRWAGQMFYSLV